MIRSAFALGGLGSGICEDEVRWSKFQSDELKRQSSIDIKLHRYS